MGPYDALSEMDDNAVIETARSVRTRLDAAPRGSQSRDELLRAMGRLYQELNLRGIADTVTEGGRPALVVELHRHEEGQTPGV